MNITLNTNNFSSQYANYNNFVKNSQRLDAKVYTNDSIAFSGAMDIPKKSKLLNPINKLFNKLTSFISDNYSEKIYTSKFAKLLANHMPESDVVGHLQVAGSVIISGMYMTQTLRNKDMDEDRKKTLAINQGLTFLVSTLGSYFVDRKINKKWNDFTLKYATNRSGDSTLPVKYGKYLQEAKANKKLHASLVDFLNDAQAGCHNPDLAKRVSGMGVLKSLLVFGTIYRFISPVAVTPFATWISNKLAAKKVEKKAAMANEAQAAKVQQPVQVKSEKA